MTATTRRTIEIAVLVALLAAIPWYFETPEDKLINVLQSVADVAATLAGFLLACLAIVTAVMNRTLIKNLRRTGHFAVLLRSTAACAVALIVVVVVALVGLFLNGIAMRAAASIVMGVAGFAAVEFAYAGYRYYQVIRHLAPDSQ